jgi:hypothetical protein
MHFVGRAKVRASIERMQVGAALPVERPARRVRVVRLQQRALKRARMRQKWMRATLQQVIQTEPDPVRQPSPRRRIHQQIKVIRSRGCALRAVVRKIRPTAIEMVARVAQETAAVVLVTKVVAEHECYVTPTSWRYRATARIRRGY